MLRVDISIYIPVWLYKNMVNQIHEHVNKVFTFQYGYIKTFNEVDSKEV
mgnify:CR=1 FL=1